MLCVNWIFHDKKILQISKILQIIKMVSLFYISGNFHKKIAFCITNNSNSKMQKSLIVKNSNGP